MAQTWNDGDNVTAAELNDLSTAISKAPSGISNMVIDTGGHLQVTLTTGTVIDAGIVPSGSGGSGVAITDNGNGTLTASPSTWYSKAGADAQFATAAQGALASTAVQPSALTPYATTASLSAYAQTANLAAVATSGKYSDLTGAPTIPASATDVGALPQNVVAGASPAQFIGYGSSLPTTANEGDLFILVTGP